MQDIMMEIASRMIPTPACAACGGETQFELDDVSGLPAAAGSTAHGTTIRFTELPSRCSGMCCGVFPALIREVQTMPVNFVIDG